MKTPHARTAFIQLCAPWSLIAPCGHFASFLAFNAVYRPNAATTIVDELCWTIMPSVDGISATV